MSKPRREKGIVYVGHLPFGLFEPQLKKYFSQFGKILRIKLSRSKKNGHSRGYAFIEFESLEAAEIAASTMNNYIIFKRSLKCHVIPKQNIHKYIFNKSKRSLPTSGDNKVSSEKELEKRAKRSASNKRKKLLKIEKTLAEKGIKFELPAF
ncbi:MKI67 FHA domain-interacting nucleolar phosphoprotein [Cryptosporidium felis]|nr:MKI67 FHA domain-interacting nucleolar phosphoprotein [Cryptosporidium felis]